MNVLIVLYQDTYHTIAIASSLDRNKTLNGEYYFVLSNALTNTTEDQFDSNLATIKDMDSMNNTENLIDSFNMETIKDMNITDIIKDSLIVLSRPIYPGEDQVHNDDDNIAIIMQPVVLFQVKYKMIQHGGHDAIAITQIVRPSQEVCFDDNNIANTQSIIYQDVHNDQYGYSITTIDEYVLIPTTTVRHTISSTVPNLTLGINGNATFSTSFNWEKYTSQLKYKDDDDNAVHEDDSMNRTENLSDSSDTDTFKDSSYLNTDTVKEMDTIKNPIDSRKNRETKVVDDVPTNVFFYQAKYKMIQPFRNSTTTTGNTTATTATTFKKEDGCFTLARNKKDTDIIDHDIADHKLDTDGEYNVRCYCNNTGGNFEDPCRLSHSVTSNDGEILLFRVMYRVQVQAKYKMVQPIHSIYSNNNDTIIASMRKS